MAWKKRTPTQQDTAPARKIETKPDRSPDSPRARDQATIACAVTIHGEVTCQEDLVIDGHVHGSVTSGPHAVTVGPDGRVKGNITGRMVAVAGRVVGDLTGEERVVLQLSAWVEGDIMAPRVVVQDGARFKGSVEMGGRRETRRARTAPDKAVQGQNAAAPAQPPTSKRGGVAAKASATRK